MVERKDVKEKKKDEEVINYERNISRLHFREVFITLFLIFDVILYRYTW
jgi:hypothetical protein